MGFHCGKTLPSHPGVTGRSLLRLNRTEGLHYARTHVLIRDNFYQTQYIPVRKPFVAQILNIQGTAGIRAAGDFDGKIGDSSFAII